MRPHGRSLRQRPVEGKRGSELRILAITVLTSIDDAGARELGHMLPVAELIRQRVVTCAELGCDGVIVSPHDIGDIRRVPGSDTLLVVTPGVRLSGAALDDHKRAGSPSQAMPITSLSGARSCTRPIRKRPLRASSLT